MGHFELIGPGSDGLYRYGGGTIELSSLGSRRWYVTIRFKSQEVDLDEYRSSDEALDAAMAWIDAAPEHPRDFHGRPRPLARENDDDEAAGEQYARDQIESSYFIDWVRDQLIEASQMPPEKVHPLKTIADARAIARDMLQQLEWDTKRDLAKSRGFYKGFESVTRDQKVVSWLSEELLQMQGEILRSRGVSERRRPKARRSAPRRRR